MTTDEAIIPADAVDDRRRRAALLKALGLDKSPPEQVELVMAIAKRYELDPLLKHVILVEGRPYLTRDGLLWIAHRSGVLDGIEVTEPAIVTLPGVGEFWRAVCTVWRKDMSKPFTYTGRYPTKGGNQRFAPEMAVKVAESMALRRAFNVSAPTIDERWDLPTVQADVDAVSVPQQPPRTLAERVQERRATVGPPSSGAAGPSPDEDDEVTQSMGAARMEKAAGAHPTPTADLVADLEDELVCGDEDVSPMALGICELLPGHKGHHKSENGTWAR
jgi:hypothetical protein